MTLKEIVGVSLFGFFCLVFQPAGAGSFGSECAFDVAYIMRQLKMGAPKEWLVDGAMKAEDITEERRKNILKLIDEAYLKGPRDFGDDAFPRCGSQT